MRTAYIVAANRTAVGKANRGVFRSTRPDDLLAHVIRGTLAKVPNVNVADIDDVVVGCAMPEGPQGMNIARIGVLLAGLPDSVPGVTVNRFCASGTQAVAQAAERVMLGVADVMVAGGVESMTSVPMGGNNFCANPRMFANNNEHVAIAYGMGITAEKVAEQWKISRIAQDQFALESHRRAIAALDAGYFKPEILPYKVDWREPDLADGEIKIFTQSVDTDEGPRRDTSIEALSKLKPAFAVTGSVTAGNSSQVSDGAAAVVIVSEKYLKQHNLVPLARFVGFAIAGVPPEVMGIGPIKAIPKLLNQTGLSLNDLDWIELNEAFAAQSLAVIRDVGLDPAKVNPQGGAIALGHPLGATGAIRSATLVHGLQRTRQRYGMITMCIGTGMGAAAIIERC